MKKIKLILMMLLLVIGMVGCQSKKSDTKPDTKKEVTSPTFAKAVEKGKLAIADNDYEKAMNMFKLALEEQKDEEILKLNQQCELIIELIEIQEKIKNRKELSGESITDSFNKMIELSDEIINIDAKSNLIKDKAKEIKKEIENDRKAYEAESKKNSISYNKESKSRKEEYMEKLSLIEYEVSTINYEGSTLDMKEASSKVLKKWDDALNEIYGVLKTQLSSSEMESLKKEQREWITIRDANAKESASEFEGGTMEGLQYTETLGMLTKQRCYELVEIYMK